MFLETFVTLWFVEEGQKFEMANMVDSIGKLHCSGPSRVCTYVPSSGRWETHNFFWLAVLGPKGHQTRAADDEPSISESAAAVTTKRSRSKADLNDVTKALCNGTSPSIAPTG